MNLSFQLDEKLRNFNEAHNTTERLRMEIHSASSLELMQNRAWLLGFRKATSDQYISLR